MSSACGAGRAVGSLRHSFGDEGRQAHFLEHIQVVVGGGAVGADAHVQSRFEHFRHRRKTGGEFQVRRRIMGDACAGMLQRADLANIHMDAVRGDQLWLRAGPVS